MPAVVEPSRAAVARSRIVLVGGWIVLAVPALRNGLESSMVLHMLVQLPLLALLGFALGQSVLHSPPAAGGSCWLRAVQRYNAGGATGLLAASFVMLLWMLPRCLDLARLDGSIDALKFVAVPAAGFAVALSWPLLPRIARAVVHLEAIATLLRFGWGYLAAEERLCLVYLAGDQQRTGELLLLAGAIYAVVVVWRPMFGSARAPMGPADARSPL